MFPVPRVPIPARCRSGLRVRVAPVAPGVGPAVREPLVDQEVRAVVVAPVARVVVPAVPVVASEVVPEAKVVVPVDPEDPEAPVDPVVPEDPVVPVAVAVVSVEPVGVAMPPVRSASPVVAPRAGASPSAPSVKSSTTWRPRPSVAFGYPAVRARLSGCRAELP